MGLEGRCSLEADFGVQSELGCMCQELAIHTHTHRHTGPRTSGPQQAVRSAPPPPPAEAQGRGPASPGETFRPSWEPWRGHGAGVWVM